MSTTFCLFVYLIHEIQDGKQIMTKNSVKLLRPKCFPIPLSVQVDPNHHGSGLLVHLRGWFSTNTYSFLGQQSNDTKKKFAASLISGFTFTMACLLYLPSTCLPTLHPRISGSQPTAPSPLSLHAAESKLTWMNNKLKWIKVSWSPPPPNSHYKLLSLNKHRVAELLESALGSARITARKNLKS